MKLDDLHRENIHKVPEGYFDDLPGRIQKRIEKEKVASGSYAFSWSMIYRIVLPVAAVIAIILLIVIEPKTSDPSTLSYEELLEDIPAEGMISFLELEEISSYDIVESVSAASLSEELDEMDENYMGIEDSIDDAMIDAILNEYDLDLENI